MVGGPVCGVRVRHKTQVCKVFSDGFGFVPVFSDDVIFNDDMVLFVVLLLPDFSVVGFPDGTTTLVALSASNCYHDYCVKRVRNVLKSN